MRHIQLYEAFGKKGIEATVYTNVDQWMEFLRWTLDSGKFISIDYNFWKERFRMVKAIYTAKTDENNNKTWFFSEYPEPTFPGGMVNVSFIKGGVMQRGVSVIEASKLPTMEKELACSYQEIMAMAKTPEEHMVQNILDNPELFKLYSEIMPLTLSRTRDYFSTAVGSDELKRKFQAMIKWIKIKDFI